MRSKRQYKARLLYFFKCTNCGRENSQTYKRRRQKEELCRNCRRHRPDPNQITLFDQPVESTAAVSETAESTQTPTSNDLMSQPGKVTISVEKTEGGVKA